MRTDATQIYKKKVTRNTLNIQQMLKLEELGLCNLKERDKHTEYSFGVEELMQILPACIVVDGWCYCLKLYKSAFDVQHIAYVAHKNPKTGVADYLHSVGCDDVMPQDESYNGHLVDALFEMVLWVNNNYKEYLAEYKDKLQHYIKSL
jgi:hypothetical protein